jgi:hypothetical protein
MKSTPPELAVDPTRARARGTRLDREWLPDPAFHRGTGWTDAEAGEVLEEFRDYWCAKAGANATKLDWQATWRNWLRKTARDQRRGPRGWHGQATTTTRVSEALALADRLDRQDSAAPQDRLW